MSLPYLLPNRVQADPYGPSPLVTDLSLKRPEMFTAASDRGPAPTLFASGDLPPFTASGVDPALLNGLPYHWRHAAASEPSPATVLMWLEQCAMDHDVYGQGDPRPHPGLMDYKSRMEGWTRDLVVPEPEFGDDEAAYPDWMKTPSTRKAEAAAEAARARQAEDARLREEIAKESARWPRDDKTIGTLVDQLAALRSQR